MCEPNYIRASSAQFCTALSTGHHRLPIPDLFIGQIYRQQLVGQAHDSTDQGILRPVPLRNPRVSGKQDIPLPHITGPVSEYLSSSPPDPALGKELIDQFQIVRLQLLHARHVVAFAVQIVRVEGFDRIQ